MQQSCQAWSEGRSSQAGLWDLGHPTQIHLLFLLLSHAASRQDKSLTCGLRLREKTVAIMSFLAATWDSRATSLRLSNSLRLFFSTEKITKKVSFLGTEAEPDQAYLGQWVLLSMSFVMFFLILALFFRLHYLEKQSLNKDAVIVKSLSSTYFLGIAMEPQQAARKQWLLLGLCFILMLCCIGLLVWILKQSTGKAQWRKDEWQS